MRTNAWPHPIVPQPWDELRDRYEGLSRAHPQMGYLLRIVESVQQSDCVAQLAATTSMHDLVVVDIPFSEPPVEVVIVCAPGSLRPPTEGNVRIQHRSHTGRDDDIQRPADEAVPLFWRFVFEKWGLRPSQEPLARDGKQRPRMHP